ncbi:MAG TPA: transporter substrate-binding domain-containing protein [Azonexus sp.]
MIASASELRVAVLDNAPPMAFRDSSGRLTGFTVEVARALCQEMRATCNLQATKLNRVVDELVAGEVDFAAVSLLETPERRAHILFAKPYFRSVSLWFARAGIKPGDSGIRVAVVSASAQERFARSRGWETVAVPTNGELIEPLRVGIAQAAIIPMGTGLGLMKNDLFRQLELISTVMNEPELSGDVAFGISPRRADLKEPLDNALDRIKRNGIYDRINSQFLPLRVN